MDIGEGLKKVFLAGVGAVATTAEAAKELVDNLVEKGELTVEQGKALNDEIRQNAKQKMKDRIFSAVDQMSPEELEQLKDRVKQAEEKAKEAPEEETGERPEAQMEPETESEPETEEAEESKETPEE